LNDIDSQFTTSETAASI